jgi:hypothetical protein
MFRCCGCSEIVPVETDGEYVARKRSTWSWASNPEPIIWEVTLKRTGFFSKEVLIKRGSPSKGGLPQEEVTLKRIGMLLGDPTENDRAIRVKGFLADGLMPKWNAKEPSKKVQVDDLIIGCNGVTLNAKTILEAMKSADVVNLTISREVGQ